MKKLRYSIVVLYNQFKFILLKYLTKRRISISFPSLISNDSELLFNTNSKISIGRRSHFERDTVISCKDGNLVIGENVYLNRNSMIVCRFSIKIGNNVKIGPNVVIYDHNHNFMDKNVDYNCKEVIIEDNVWIGANTAILMGAHICENSVVGAGTVISKYIPSNTVVHSNIVYKYKKIDNYV